MSCSLHFKRSCRPTSHLPVLRTAFPWVPVLYSTMEAEHGCVTALGPWTLPVEAWVPRGIMSPKFSAKFDLLGCGGQPQMSRLPVYFHCTLARSCPWPSRSPSMFLCINMRIVHPEANYTVRMMGVDGRMFTKRTPKTQPSYSERCPVT